MLMKGSKIKLKKEIPTESPLIKVGDVFEVTEVDEDGSIIFKSVYGFGAMTRSEFEKYFEECKKESEWHEEEHSLCSTEILDILEEGMGYCRYNVSYKTDNENYVKVKLDMLDDSGRVIHSYYAKAFCDPFEKFEFKSGYKIALARAFSNALVYYAMNGDRFTF